MITTPSKRKLRIAVVGVGHLGQHHARVLANHPDVELVGVVDPRPDQVKAIADRHQTQIFTDYRQLIGLVDAVSIAAPTKFHHEIAMELMSRDIHCMIEKPITAQLSHAEALVQTAKARGLILQVGHIERFNPALSTLDGFKLKPKYIACERLGAYTFRSTDIGVVLDLMIHDIDLILSLVKSPVKSVQAVGVSLLGGHEDIANARIEFANGCIANLTASRVSYQTVRKMRLWGADGYATLDFAGKQGTLVRPADEYRKGQWDLNGVDLGKPDAVRDYVFGKVFHLEERQGQGQEPLALELEEFVNAILTGSRPTVTGEEALAAMKLADRVLVSIASHQWEPGAEALAGPKFWTRSRPPVRESIENDH